MAWRKSPTGLTLLGFFVLNRLGKFKLQVVGPEFGVLLKKLLTGGDFCLVDSLGVLSLEVGIVERAPTNRVKMGVVGDGLGADIALL